MRCASNTTAEVKLVLDDVAAIHRAQSAGTAFGAPKHAQAAVPICRGCPLSDS